ncbi:hypothetical protein BRC94_07455 [Halobacteriales archaeon QS_5_70_17]|nr:MAG: hypothetical protein BRC94_07455 [Halobacteriales archaeon QS_5_70_17]
MSITRRFIEGFEGDDPRFVERTLAVDRRLDAVADLAWDDRADFHDVPDGAVVEVPPGEYTVAVHDDWTTVRHAVVAAADPDDPPVFRTEGSVSGRVCQFKGTHVALEGLVFDNGESYDGGDVALRADLEDGLHWRDIDVRGWSGLKDDGGDWTFYPSLSRSDGVGLVRRCEKVGPSRFGGHGESAGAGGTFRGHEGTIWYAQCRVENQGGDGGLYTGKHPGSVNFYRCYFANNDMALARMGAGSEMRDCVLVADWENAHPDNEIVTEPTGTNGLYVSSAQFGKAGGGLYGVDVWLRDPQRAAMAACLINGSDRPDELRDVRIRVDADGTHGLWMADPADQRLSNHVPPPEPWSTTVENLHVSGTGDMDGAAILIENRHGSTLRDVHVDAPGADRAVDLDGTRDATREGVHEGSARRPREDPGAVLDGPLAPDRR